VPGEEHFRKLERMYDAAPVNGFYRPVLRVREGEAEVVLKVRPELFHAARAVHGAVIFKALDDACWFAVNSLFEDVCVLTSSFNLHLLRPVSEGELRARGRVVHSSRRLFLAEAVAVDSEERQVARGGGTFMRTAIRLTAEIGYA
jgi:uncharacterized protein (TIGR00369 family)